MVSGLLSSLIPIAVRREFEPSISTTEAQTLRSRLTRGVAWNTVYQLTTMFLSFIGLLVTSRLIPPADFGLVMLAITPVAAVNSLSSISVVTHALYAPKDVQPDWNLYFQLGLAAQGLAFLLCNLIALGCWFSTPFRPLAPFIHVASIGIIFEAFSKLDLVMSQRELDFRRIELLKIASEVFSFATILVLTLLGFGAWGLVLGGNVVRSAPFALHLLLRRRWRPEWRSFRGAGWTSAKAPIVFALHQGAANVWNSARLFAESLLTPLAFVPSEVGLLSRASALFGQTFGRAAQALSDSALPALPPVANDPERFRRFALILHRILGAVLTAGTLFLVVAGPILSRALYGDRWIDADPLIAPCSLWAGLMLYVAVCSTTLVAAGRMADNARLLLVNALSAAPALAALALKVELVRYPWVQFGSTAVSSLYAVWLLRPLLGIRRLIEALAPCFVAALTASAATYVLLNMLPPVDRFSLLTIAVGAYAASHLIVLRLAFASWLVETLRLVPFRRFLSRSLGLAVT
jgi:O-antigen/teichoic acid export membrane protein